MFRVKFYGAAMGVERLFPEERQWCIFPGGTNRGETSFYQLETVDKNIFLLKS